MEQEKKFSNENFIVTTGAKINNTQVKLAKLVALKLGVSYIARNGMSLAKLRQKYAVEFILVAKNQQLIVDTKDGELFYHPNMAYLRIKNMGLGKKDHFVEATSLQTGDSILDCTLGFASDALVASFTVGRNGKVVGLEKSPLISSVIGYALSHGIHTDVAYLKEAMKNITVLNVDALDYLQAANAKSFDVVYFDPMFRHPLQQSLNLNPLRKVADHRPITTKMIEFATKIARKRVVFKESSKSSEFLRLGFSKFVGGKYSNIRYGVMEII